MTRPVKEPFFQVFKTDFGDTREGLIPAKNAVEDPLPDGAVCFLFIENLEVILFYLERLGYNDDGTTENRCSE